MRLLGARGGTRMLCAFVQASCPVPDGPFLQATECTHSAPVTVIKCLVLADTVEKRF
jgi:hypothetical protein